MNWRKCFDEINMTCVTKEFIPIELGQLFRVVAGGTPARSNPEYWEGDIPWVKIYEMLQDVVESTEESITPKGLDNSSAKLLPKGTLLLSIFATVGRTAILGLPATTNQAIVGLIPTTNEIHIRYVRHFLDSAIVQLSAQGRGVAQNNINSTILKALEIPIPHKNGKPDLAEQKRIAAILDKADAIRRKRRQALQLTDDFLRSLFLDMFGDPVTNPKGWEVAELGSIAQSRLGKMLDTKKQTGNSSCPYLANINVQWGRFVFEELRQMDFSEADKEEFKLINGDVLVCEGGEVGRSAIWRNQKANVFFQKALHRIRLDQNKVLPEYFLYYMWFMSKHNGFKDYTTSATIAHLTGVKLKTLSVPIPDLNLQKIFQQIHYKLNKINKALDKCAAESKNLFASLQQRAFKGEL